MPRLRQCLLLPFTIALASLAGCVEPAPPVKPPPVPPPADTVAQGVVESLFDMGFYTEVGLTRTIGQHYNPAEDTWKILACFQYVAVDGSRGENCVDSINAFRLTNDTWIVGVTIDEVYRWRAIGVGAGPAT